MGSTYYLFFIGRKYAWTSKSVGSRIARQYPKAVSLLCTTHQLNRVIIQSCTEPSIRDMIGTIDSVSIFPSYLCLSPYLRKWYPFNNILNCEVFEYSAKRSFVLTNVIERSEAKRKKLKQLCRT